MTIRLSLAEGRGGQFLALGIPAILAVFISFFVVKPLLHGYQVRADEISAKRQAVSHLLRMRALIPGLRQQASGLQLFPASDADAIAGANLQSVIETLAGRANASLESTAILAVQPAPGPRPIAIDVDLTANWPALVALLGGIDLAQPRMIVSDLDITDAGQPDGAKLQISFTVTAFKASAAP
jgi:general secretion pathway protein M